MEKIHLPKLYPDSLRAPVESRILPPCMRSPFYLQIFPLEEGNPKYTTYDRREYALSDFGYSICRSVSNMFPRYFRLPVIKSSMTDAILENDDIIFREIIYLGNSSDRPYPRKGRVVVFSDTLDYYINVKRIAGLPGDETEIGVVPPKHIFVLGDNSEESIDSRSFGPVPIQNVFGIVEWIVHNGVTRPANP